MKFLVDTGSSTTIVSRKAAEELRGNEGALQTKVCACKLITLGGPCKVEGEFKLGLGRWTRRGGNLMVHLVGNMPRDYEGIIGCDLLAKVGAKIKTKGGRWTLKIGREEYKCERFISNNSATVGAITQETNWRTMLKTEYADIFFCEGDVLGVTGETVHEIPLKREGVTYVKERRYPQALRHHIREEISNLKRQGIVVDSASPFNSPLWAVKKKALPGETDEKYRVVIDYRKLNDNTVDEKYPIPRFDDILDRLHGSTIFSTLDLKAGYHQIKMHPRDQHKTAFSFERGHYEFTRMPFGLKNAPITFQRLMDEFLRGLDEGVCQVYMDDLLVFSKTEEEHVDHLRSVFQRIRKFGLKLSSEKSLLGQARINFLGHIISSDGVRPDRSKVEAIQRMAIPRDVKGIRRLLGSLNYYRRFIPEMADRLVSINNLLKKGSKVVITPAMENNIRQCMDRLQCEPVLAFPDFAKLFTVTTDASEYALGAVLSQEGHNGDKPVAYASRRLTEAETRYSALERELLAIVWAVDHFRPYIFGRRFKVQTDHKPLQWVGKLKESSARITRWKELLSQYTMDVVYKPGKENVVADWLSRALVVNAVENEAGEPSGDVRQFLQEWTPDREGERDPTEANDETQEEEDSIDERPTEMDEIEEIVNDKRHQIIWKTRTSGTTKIEYERYGKSKINMIWSQPGIRDDLLCRALKDASKPGQTYHIYVGNATVWDKIKRLWRLEQIGMDRNYIRCTLKVDTVKDEETQREVTLAYHQGKTNHRGVQETLHALKRKYFWWGMQKTIKEVIGNCAVCLTTKYDRHPPRAVQEETPTAVAPLTDILIDTFTWRGYKWVTVIDSFSKIAMAHLVRDRSSESVLEALRTWFRFYGVPDRVASDGGREFDNAGIRAEAKTLDIAWHINTPGHPKSRGGIERLHSTLSDHLRIYQVEKGLEPDVAMDKAVSAYNHSVHAVTGFSPFEILFGLRNRRRDAISTAVEADVADCLVLNRVTLGKRWDKVRQRMECEKSKRVARENLRVKDIFGDLKIGAIVYRKKGTNRGKEVVRYEGPFRVIALREHNVVSIESVSEPKKRRTVHLEQLKLPIIGLTQP